MEAKIQHDDFLNTVGLTCPEPLMMLRNKIRNMAAGKVLLIKATDPTTERDFKHFCHFLGHKMLSNCYNAGHYYYWISRK